MILVLLGYIVGLITSTFCFQCFIYLIQVNYLVFRGDYLSLVTSILVTNSYVDFFFNFISLLVIYYLFGSKAGKLEYVVFFLSGILGNIFSLYFFPPLTASAGASGGIFGILAFYLSIDMLEQRKFDVYGFAILLMVFVFSDILPNVDYLAHIGGILGGVILAFVVSYFNKKKGIRYNL
ncbi:rhomboid family intramembrane serine protease [Acidianus sulfidivorans JP7]|uniref:Rhomboid family intramembrane serine protease n=2 Tax=Acidianus TaxID=12914 RepID=A0A2U9IQM9_9CREN|nr:rhomboid family intramembrane serine protease [Acidianus sulfidivorans JP7]